MKWRSSRHATVAVCCPLESRVTDSTSPESTSSSMNDDSKHVEQMRRNGKYAARQLTHLRKTAPIQKPPRLLGLRTHRSGTAPCRSRLLRPVSLAPAGRPLVPAVALR